VDGGAVEYLDGGRPFTDAELQHIRTPFLIEAHGPWSVISMGSEADRLDALGRPVEVLYFAKAAHAVKLPSHRWQSLNTHTDWFRFWLQDKEDSDPAKREQYARWRKMRQQVVALTDYRE
jgi:hypothetical protein